MLLVTFQWPVVFYYLCVAMEFTVSLLPGNCAHLYHPWDAVIAMHYSGAEISSQKGSGKF